MAMAMSETFTLHLQFSSPHDLHFHKSNHRNPNECCGKAGKDVSCVVHTQVNPRESDQKHQCCRADPYNQVDPGIVDASCED